MPGTGLYASGGIIPISTFMYGNAADPMDAASLRDGVLHGLLHAADSRAQVRVNYMHNPVSQDPPSTETISDVDDWHQLAASPFGPWPLTQRADGSGYQLRVRIRVGISSTPATATFRVVIAPWGRLSRGQIEEEVDSVYEVTTTSGTSQWRTGTSQGPLGDSRLLTVSADQCFAWTQTTSVYNAVSGASPRDVSQVLVAAHVFAKTTDTSILPELYALHLQEFVG